MRLSGAIVAEKLPFHGIGTVALNEKTPALASATTSCSEPLVQPLQSTSSTGCVRKDAALMGKLKTT